MNFENMTDEDFELLSSEVHKLYDLHRDVVVKVLGDQIQDMQLEHLLLENINDLYED